MMTRDLRQLRRVLLWSIAVLLQGCSQPLLDHAGDPALLGCWHFVRQTIQEADGKTSERDIDCTGEYLASRSISQCLLKAGGKEGGDRYEYSYRIIRDGVMESKVVAHSAGESDAGITREVEYKIDGDHLKVTAHPQTIKSNPPAVPLRVETFGARQAAPELCTPIGILAFSPEKVIATVNGKPITQANLDILIRDDPKSDTREERAKLTENLIDAEVLAQEAIRQKIPERYMIPSDSAATRALYLSLLHEVAEHMKPSDAEVHDEYDREQKLHGDREYRVRHIVVDTEGKAREIIARLDKGEDFAVLAKGSVDPRSAARGGDLGWGSLTTANQVFIDAVRDLRVGDYTSVPVQTPMGWHVIRLDEVRLVRFSEFDEVKVKIAKELLEKNLRAYGDSLKASAAVVRY